MKRKVIKFGQASHVISLPKDWMKSQGINGDSYVIVEEEPDSSLSIRSDEKKDVETRIDIEYPGPDRIFTLLVSSYINGYDTVVVTAPKGQKFNAEDLKVMKDSVNLLSGTELVSESSRVVEYDFYIRTLDRDIDKEIQRMFSVTSDMLNDALAFLHDPEAIREQIVDRDDIVDRINLFVKRQVKDKVMRTRGERPPTIFIDQHKISQITEMLADYIVDMAEVINMSEVKFTDEELKVLREQGEYAQEFLKQAQYAFVQKNKGAALEALRTYYKKRNEMRPMLWNLAKKRSGNSVDVFATMVFLYKIMSLTREITKAVVDISVAEARGS
jgi:phosphate uptake regulator